MKIFKNVPTALWSSRDNVNMHKLSYLTSNDEINNWGRRQMNLMFVDSWRVFEPRLENNDSYSLDCAF